MVAMRRLAIWSAILGFCLAAVLGCALATSSNHSASTETSSNRSLDSKPTPKAEVTAIGPAFVQASTGIAQHHAVLQTTPVHAIHSAPHDAALSPRRTPLALSIRSTPLRI
jgi:hypothetical protein